jgi:hypothetical protein
MIKGELLELDFKARFLGKKLIVMNRFWNGTDIGPLLRIRDYHQLLDAGDLSDDACYSIQGTMRFAVIEVTVSGK